MGRDGNLLLIVEEHELTDGRSVLEYRIIVPGSEAETFTSPPFRRGALGLRPFDEILPAELRRRLRPLLSRFRSLRIVSHESWIPWDELTLQEPGRGFAERSPIDVTVTRRQPMDFSVDLGEPERAAGNGPWLGSAEEGSWRGRAEESFGGEDSEPEPEDVHVTTVAPASVRPGESFLVEVVVHLASYEVEASPGQVTKPGASVLSLRHGARLTVRLVPVSAAFSLEGESEVEIAWKPPARRAEFLLTASPDLEKASHFVRIEFWLGEVQLARSFLVVQSVSGSSAEPGRVSQTFPRSAFASYAHVDQSRVQDRVAALEAWGIDVFLNSLDIRQGANWQDVLHREVGSRDRFLLFWSCAAGESEWVEREWRYALTHRGDAYILPNALEPPERCPPPPELAHLQFGSAVDRLRRDWIAGA